MTAESILLKTGFFKGQPFLLSLNSFLFSKDFYLHIVWRRSFQPLGHFAFAICAGLLNIFEEQG